MGGFGGESGRGHVILLCNIIILPKILKTNKSIFSSKLHL